MYAGESGVELEPVETALQQAGGVGEVLQQLRVRAKTDEERLVPLLDHLAEELACRAPFNVDEISLAGADVHQHSDGQGKIRLFRKILDGLQFAVLENLEVVLRKIVDEGAVFIADGGEHAHQIDVDFDRRVGDILRARRLAGNQCPCKYQKSRNPTCTLHIR